MDTDTTSSEESDANSAPTQSAVEGTDSKPVTPDWTPMTGVHKRGCPKSKTPGVSVPHKRPRPPSPNEDLDKMNVNDDHKTKSKGELKTELHGIVKRKRIRKFKCRICSVIVNTQAEAN